MRYLRMLGALLAAPLAGCQMLPDSAGSAGSGGPAGTVPAPAARAPGGAPTRDVRLVVLHRPGPAWLPGRSPFEQPGIGEHVAHYRQWLQSGKLALGGPHLDAAGGGMMIPEAGVGEDEVRAFAAADPAVRGGLLTFEVRPWLIGMRK